MKCQVRFMSENILIKLHLSTSMVLISLFVFSTYLPYSAQLCEWVLFPYETIETFFGDIVCR